MASSAKHFLLFLLITLLSSLQTHARDSQFFNKVPSTTTTTTTTTNVVPDTTQPLNNQQEQPNFLPENENSYGLHGHDATPSTTATATTESKQPLNKYLPKNYNPVAYVTEPEDINESTTFTGEKSFTSNPENNNNNNYYYNGEHNYNYNGGSSFNNQPQGLSDTRFRSGATYNSGGFRPQPQGMSDTRFVENGKYFYDVNAEKYSSNHPYETLRGNQARNEYNNKNFYGNNENAYEFNSENSMDEFQDEENNLP